MLEVSIYERSAVPQLDPALLPALRRLSVEFCDVANRAAGAEELCSRLHEFPRLADVHYSVVYMDGFLDICLPPALPPKRGDPRRVA